MLPTISLKAEIGLKSRSARRNSWRGGRVGKAVEFVTNIPEHVSARLIIHANCQRSSRRDLAITRARCVVDQAFGLSERHGRGIIAKSSVAEARFRSKISPRVYSSRRRRFVIDSSKGGVFGLGAARFDALCLREVEFLWFRDSEFIDEFVFIGELFCVGVPIWEGELVWEGEPPGEPASRTF
jgi:hypothetical protein